MNQTQLEEDKKRHEQFPPGTMDPMPLPPPLEGVPVEDDEVTSLTVPKRGTVKPQVKTGFSQILNQRFQRLLKKDGNPDGRYTLGELEKLLKVNKSQLSQYANGKPVGDVARIEASINDFFKREAARDLEGAKVKELFQWSVTNRVRNIARLCVRNGYMGAIIAEPGMGKSCAISLLHEELEFQDSIVVELHRFLGGGTPSALSKRVMDGCDTRSYHPRRETRGQWIARHFEYSGRLLIIDNADELPRAGLEWVVGFFNHTKCPVLMVGNEELEDTIKLVPRAISRIGVQEVIRLKERDTLEPEARQLIERHWPDGMEALPAVVGMMRRPGMLRSVRNSLVTAAGLWGNNERAKVLTPTEVFNASVEMLPRVKVIGKGGK